MKRTVLAALGALLLASSHGAAQQPETSPFVPVWTDTPGPADGDRYFPQALLTREGFVGQATLCCIPKDDGRLSCFVGYEWPEGTGLGAAGLGLSTKYKMSQESLATFRLRGLRYYQLQIPFITAPETQEGRDVLLRLDEIGSRPGICAASPSPTS